MRKASVVVVVLQLLAILATASSVAADPRFHGRGGGARFHGHSVHNRAPSFHKHSFDRHRFFPRHFGASGVVVAPPVVVYSPPLLDVSPRYYSAPPVYAPPVIYSPPPFTQPTPAPPRVVHYPAGRYELRGDGIGTPYTWVWIPNPPPPPAPPTAPPAGAPISGDPLPARQPVYQWVDEQGVAHWTNRLDRVPWRYREEAKGT